MSASYGHLFSPTGFRLLLASLLWLCALPLFAQTPAESSEPRPVLVFDRLEHDFGELRQGKKVETTFEIRNDGNATLRVRQIVPTCGCTALLPLSRELAPGEQRRITVTLDTRERRGDSDNYVHFHSNDPENPVITLVIKADIRVYLELRPQQIDLTGLSPGESRRVGVRVHNTSRRPVRLIDLDSSRPEIRASTSQRVIAPGQVAVMYLDIQVPETAGTRFSGRVRIRTDHPDYAVLTLPVRVVVLGGNTTLPKVKTRLPKAPGKVKPAIKAPEPPAKH